MGPGVSHLGSVPVVQLPVTLTETKLIHFSELRFLPLWNGDDHLTSDGSLGVVHGKCLALRLPYTIVAVIIFVITKDWCLSEMMVFLCYWICCLVGQ